ncbi:hypothetical protein [Caulobacter phage DCM]|uniref:Uncharacterized protein n=1 Tax=Caulobacter phage DCM TaxID=3020391 RepID=A0AAF0B8T1_9CAUD|nr:hypothetical protein [Caulobacter phage DCM]WCD56096.1 hypothetical protein [Caulobacter phage BL199]
MSKAELKPDGTAERPFYLNTSGEEYRTYHYADGKSYTIADPVDQYIFLGKSGEWTQRVIDAKGVTHRPTPGWIAISWKPRPGEPAFVA